MKLEQYIKDAARTCPDLTGKELSGQTLNNLHMIMGLETEVSELTDVFKKHVAYGKPIDWVNVEEEVADVMWYLVNFCRINNIDLEKALTNNINKLRVRFPDKFDADKAINRNVDYERKELEK